MCSYNMTFAYEYNMTFVYEHNMTFVYDYSMTFMYKRLFLLNLWLFDLYVRVVVKRVQKSAFLSRKGIYYES